MSCNVKLKEDDFAVVINNTTGDFRVIIPKDDDMIIGDNALLLMGGAIVMACPSQYKSIRSKLIKIAKGAK